MIARSRLGIKSKYTGYVSFDKFDCEEVTVHRLAMDVLDHEPVLKQIFLDSHSPLSLVTLENYDDGGKHDGDLKGVLIMPLKLELP